MTFQKGRAAGVTPNLFVRRMGRSIYLNYELRFATYKVGVIVANGHLASKFEVVELTVPELRPEPRFSTGRLTT